MLQNVSSWYSFVKCIYNQLIPLHVEVIHSYKLRLIYAWSVSRKRIVLFILPIHVFSDHWECLRIWLRTKNDHELIKGKLIEAMGFARNSNNEYNSPKSYEKNVFER